MPQGRPLEIPVPGGSWLIAAQGHSVGQSASPERVTLLYIDLNGLKAVVNDCYGHGRGDDVLAAIGRHMKPLLRRGEMLARIGGDEFVVVLPEDTQGQRSRQLTEAIRAAIRRPHSGIELAVPRNAVIGVAVSPDDGTDPVTLLHAADERMYDHKGRHSTAS